MKIRDLFVSTSDVSSVKNKCIRIFGLRPGYFVVNPTTLEVDVNYSCRIPSELSELSVKFHKIDGDLMVGINSQLDSLKNFPIIINGSLTINQSKINNLDFLPKIIRGTFTFIKNNRIRNSIEYRKVLYIDLEGTFLSHNNKIDDIINECKGAENRKHWPRAIAALKRIKL